MRCFVIMPIGDPRKDPALAHRFEHLYSDWIKPAVEGCALAGEDHPRINCHRADKDVRPGEIITQVIEALSEADVVIADLTGRNPNVFYELGVRHALRNNTILIAQDIDDIPFDLRGLRTICYRYEPESLLQLRASLRATLAEMFSGATQIDNPVRRLLYEREIAKLIAAPVPPGYDALRQLVDEMQTIRQDLSESITEMRGFVESATASPALEAADVPDKLSRIEGAWRAAEHGGLYIVKRVGAELRGPYCYANDDNLSAHLFNFQILGNQLLCRFRWFRAPIEGCVLLRLIRKDRLHGGWWFLEHLPRAAEKDLRYVHDRLPRMQPLTLMRIPMPRPLPHWAVEYFKELSPDGGKV